MYVVKRGNAAPKRERRIEFAANTEAAKTTSGGV
jgi:hypothetical protein